MLETTTLYESGIIAELSKFIFTPITITENKLILKLFFAKTRWERKRVQRSKVKYRLHVYGVLGVGAGGGLRFSEGSPCSRHAVLCLPFL